MNILVKFGTCLVVGLLIALDMSGIAHAGAKRQSYLTINQPAPYAYGDQVSFTMNWVKGDGPRGDYQKLYVSCSKHIRTGPTSTYGYTVYEQYGDPNALFTLTWSEQPDWCGATLFDYVYSQKYNGYQAYPVSTISFVDNL